MTSFFSGFTIAKLGIRSSQQGLQITGNNISNINTTGYTRQRIEQISLRSGTTDRYACSTDIRIGMGSLVTNITQIRDPYLDIRYRNEAANVGYYDEKLTNLDDLTSILDEVTKNGLHTGIEELRTQLEKLVDGSNNPNNQELQNAVRGAAQELVSLLNKYSADLKTLKENAVDGLEQNKDTVNTILTNIRDLNVEIRNSQIHGDNALELVDRRNTLIDELSEYVKIKVTYTDEIIADGIKVDRLTIELDSPGTDPSDRLTLVDGSFANQFELVEPSLANDDYELSLTGLTNIDGMNPLQAEINETMKKLNGMVRALQVTNEQFADLADQKNAWNNDVKAAGFQVTDFHPANIDGKRQTLKDAVSAALQAYQAETDPTQKEILKQRLEDARKDLSTFNRLANRNSEMNSTEATLNAQRESQLNSLDAALKEQGLTYTPTPDGVLDMATGIPIPGTVSIKITTPNVDLIGTDNSVSKFGVVANDSDGSLSLQVGGTEFKNIALGTELQAKMQDLNDLVKSLQDVNDQFLSLADKEKEWTDIANSYKPAFDSTHFGPDKIDNKRELLNKAIEKAKADYDANPNDANKKDLQEAEDNLTSFNVLADQRAAIDKSRTDLGAQRDKLLTDLQTALKEQRLDFNGGTPPTANLDGTVSISISGGTPNIGNVTVLDNTNQIAASFGTAADGATGDLQLQVGGNTFDTIAAGDWANPTDISDPNHKIGLDTKENLYAGNDLYGVLQADLDHLNGKGEFDEPATSIRGISYYERTLDSFAQQLAETFNDLNNLNNLNDPDNFVKDLFASSDGVSTITASNITISDAWMSGEISITTSTDPNADDNDFSGTNIHNMIGALNGDLTFYALDENGNPIKDGNDLRVLFKGSFEEMLVNSNSILGQDVKSSTTLLENYATAATDRAVSRDNVSTVDLNEEGINLIQYQKSFSAACRVMTTLDEMLDSLLNM